MYSSRRSKMSSSQKYVRNYLYNIWEKSNQNIFAIIPGKFSLFPSFCSEFSKKHHQKEVINNKIKSSNKIN